MSVKKDDRYFEKFTKLKETVQIQLRSLRISRWKWIKGSLKKMAPTAIAHFYDFIGSKWFKRSVMI